MVQAQGSGISRKWTQPPPPGPSTRAHTPATRTEAKPKNIPRAIFCRAEGSSLQRSSKGSSRWSFTGTRISTTTTLARRSQASGIWARGGQARQAGRAEGALGRSWEHWPPDCPWVTQGQPFPLSGMHLPQRGKSGMGINQRWQIGSSGLYQLIVAAWNILGLSMKTRQDGSVRSALGKE